MIDKLNSIQPIQKAELNKTKNSEKNHPLNIDQTKLSANDEIKKYIAEYKSNNNLVSLRKKLILHVVKHKFGNELIISNKGQALIESIESSLTSHPDIEELINSIIKENA